VQRIARIRLPTIKPSRARCGGTSAVADSEEVVTVEAKNGVLDGRARRRKVEFLDDIPTINLEWWTFNFPGFLGTANPDVKSCIGDAYDGRMSGFSGRQTVVLA